MADENFSKPIICIHLATLANVDLKHNIWNMDCKSVSNIASGLPYFANYRTCNINVTSIEITIG